MIVLETKGKDPVSRFDNSLIGGLCPKKRKIGLSVCRAVVLQMGDFLRLDMSTLDNPTG